MMIFDALTRCRALKCQFVLTVVYLFILAIFVPLFRFHGGSWYDMRRNNVYSHIHHLHYLTIFITLLRVMAGRLATRYGGQVAWNLLWSTVVTNSVAI